MLSTTSNIDNSQVVSQPLTEEEANTFEAQTSLSINFIRSVLGNKTEAFVRALLEDNTPTFMYKRLANVLVTPTHTGTITIQIKSYLRKIFENCETQITASDFGRFNFIVFILKAHSYANVYVSLHDTAMAAFGMNQDLYLDHDLFNYIYIDQSIRTKEERDSFYQKALRLQDKSLRTGIDFFQSPYAKHQAHELFFTIMGSEAIDFYEKLSESRLTPATFPDKLRNKLRLRNFLQVSSALFDRHRLDILRDKNHASEYYAMMEHCFIFKITVKDLENCTLSQSFAKICLAELLGDKDKISDKLLNSFMKYYESVDKAEGSHSAAYATLIGAGEAILPICESYVRAIERPPLPQVQTVTHNNKSAPEVTPRDLTSILGAVLGKDVSLFMSLLSQDKILHRVMQELTTDITRSNHNVDTFKQIFTNSRDRILATESTRYNFLVILGSMLIVNAASLIELSKVIFDSPRRVFICSKFIATTALPGLYSTPNSRYQFYAAMLDLHYRSRRYGSSYYFIDIKKIHGSSKGLFEIFGQHTGKILALYFSVHEDIESDLQVLDAAGHIPDEFGDIFQKIFARYQSEILSKHANLKDFFTFIYDLKVKKDFPITKIIFSAIQSFLDNPASTFSQLYQYLLLCSIADKKPNDQTLSKTFLMKDYNAYILELESSLKYPKTTTSVIRDRAKGLKVLYQIVGHTIFMHLMDYAKCAPKQLDKIHLRTDLDTTSIIELANFHKMNFARKNSAQFLIDLFYVINKFDLASYQDLRKSHGEEYNYYLDDFRDHLFLKATLTNDYKEYDPAVQTTFQAFLKRFLEVNAKVDNPQHQRDPYTLLSARENNLSFLYKIVKSDLFVILQRFLVHSPLTLERFLQNLSLANSFGEMTLLYPHYRDKILATKSTDLFEEMINLGKIIDLACILSISSTKTKQDFLDNFNKPLHLLTKLMGQALVDNFFEDMGIGKLELSFDQFTKRIPLTFLAKLACAREAMLLSYYTPIFDQFLISDFTGRPFEASDGLLDFNRAIRTTLAAAGIDLPRAFDSNRTPTEFTHGSLSGNTDVIQLILAFWEDLNQLYDCSSDNSKVITLIDQFRTARLKGFVHGSSLLPDQARDIFINIKNAPSSSKSNILNALQDKLEALKLTDPKFIEFMGHLKREISLLVPLLNNDDFSKQSITATKHFIIAPWDKTRPDTFDLGTMVGCCLAPDGGYFHALVQRRMDDSMFMHVVSDKHTGKAVSLAWLYFGRALAPNEGIYVVANFFELASSYSKDSILRDRIVSELRDYIAQYTADIGAKGFVINPLTYGIIPDFKQLPQIEIKFEKVGGYLSHEGNSDTYYLNSLDTNKFYNYPLPAAAVKSAPPTQATLRLTTTPAEDKLELTERHYVKQK